MTPMTTDRNRGRWLVVATWLLFAAMPVAAAEYPPGAVASVRDYGAVGDGVADDTAAIQKALDAHPNGNRIIYLPAGTYLITDTLRWPAGPHGGVAHKRVILEGQSRDGTIIRLKDNCNGFGDPAKPKAMVWTGQKPAQRFRNGIRSLTFDTGAGNPGAIGVQYIANNQGSVRDVLIRSGDPQGAGVIGLDLGYTDEQGPCLIQDVTVRGFDVGVSTKHVVNSVVFERLTLEGQRAVGLRNDGQCVSIRGLVSRNAVTAVENKSANSLLTLVEGELTGGTGGAAIDNSGAAFVRGVTVTGYELGVRNTTEAGTGQDAPAGRIDAWCSHEVKTLFGGAGDAARSLQLPIEETPRAPHPPLVHWASPEPPPKGEDATAAVQAAIDSGAAVVYFPPGEWKINGDVIVKPTVQRLTALEGRIGGSGTFIARGDGDAALHVDRMDLIYQGLSLRHESRRALVVSGVTWGTGRLELAAGCGPVFLEDACLGPLHIPEGVRVWARQLNIEHRDDTKVTNAGGDLWVLGYKTENAGTLIATTGGGRTEVLGGFCYAQGKPKTTPMFVVEDAALSVTIGETTWNGRNYAIVVRQRVGVETRELPRVFWRANKATMLPLFVAPLP